MYMKSDMDDIPTFSMLSSMARRESGRVFLFEADYFVC
jgi:hypothetical protein